MATVHGKILAGEKLLNHELFTKIFLINIHRYTKNVFGICTDCSLLAKFFFANIAFTCMVRQNFPVYGITYIFIYYH